MKKILLELIFLIWICLCLIPEINSQKITNIRFEQEGKMINIFYDLSGDGVYEVKVFCSQDGGSFWGNPLLKVSGDVGKNQKFGIGKKIVWDVLTEREEIQGDIIFKVEAVPPIFTGESGTFTDIRDGKIYKWIKIGDQIWMAENLNYSEVPWSICYANKESNCAIYGRLHDWKFAQKACPAGWHLPSDGEWMALVSFLGGEGVAGGKMKETGPIHWDFPNTGATNLSGFTALPGGGMNFPTTEHGLGTQGYFWSSYKAPERGALVFQVSSDNANLKFQYQSEKDKYSVRCVTD